MNWIIKITFSLFSIVSFLFLVIYDRKEKIQEDFEFEKLTMSPLHQISELQGKNVRISNPDVVREKLNKIRDDGNDTIHVIFDYDKTLSLPDKKRVPDYGTLDIFAIMDTTPDEIKKGLRQMWVNIESLLTNPNLKIPFLISKIDECVIQYETYLTQLPPEVNLDAIQEKSVKTYILREGIKECFDSLKNNSIPITIISAGLGEAIDATLNAQHIKHDNVRVIANYIKFKEGKMLGFTDKYIHVFNKNEEAIKSTKHSEELMRRQNIILVGDALTDVKMADSAPESATKLTIGFLNSDPEKHLQTYMDTFDIVLVEDMTMDIINAILRYILS